MIDMNQYNARFEFINRKNTYSPHRKESPPAPPAAPFPASPAASVLGILYARAREVGLTAGGVAWVTIGAVEPVKELERGGRLGEDFGLISMMKTDREDRGAFPSCSLL
jgi:hypothetical protein